MKELLLKVLSNNEKYNSPSTLLVQHFDLKTLELRNIWYEFLPRLLLPSLHQDNFITRTIARKLTMILIRQLNYL